MISIATETNVKFLGLVGGFCDSVTDFNCRKLAQKKLVYLLFPIYGIQMEMTVVREVLCTNLVIS